MKNIIKSFPRYQIVQQIASGGMGAVAKAKLLGVEGFEKIVAIKTLLPRYAHDEEFVRRFIFEAKLVANLVHENIVQIYQLDRVDEEYFFVLEFVDGISLYDFVEFHKLIDRRLPAALAVFIASRAARALAYAHSRCDSSGKPLNIIHCDVCPHNILINKEGVPKLTDFGIARAATAVSTNKVAGKLAFMSPEQCSDPAHLTKAADIYSLGVVLFYMLSCHYSRDIHTDRDTLLDQIRNNYVNYAALPDDLSDELRAILEKMLATDPQARYVDCSELARHLDYYIYRDGYGPSAVMLSEYMRSIMPGRFGDMPDADGKTEVLPPDFFDHHQVSTEL